MRRSSVLFSSCTLLLRLHVLWLKIICPIVIWSTQFLANHCHSCFNETAGAWWVKRQAHDSELKGSNPARTLVEARQMWMGMTRETLLKGKAQYSCPPCTN
jgi:hypothetical protein